MSPDFRVSLRKLTDIGIINVSVFSKITILVF